MREGGGDSATPCCPLTWYTPFPLSRPSARYGPHFDGGGTDGRRMTAIAYANCGWRPEHGGALELLEEEAEGGECWRAIPPAADTLLLFRSDRMLHKVAPSHSTRFALTTFFYAHVL